MVFFLKDMIYSDKWIEYILHNSHTHCELYIKIHIYVCLMKKYLLSFPYSCTLISSDAIGVTLTVVFAEGTSHVAFCDVHVGLVKPARTAASILNNSAAT